MSGFPHVSAKTRFSDVVRGGGGGAFYLLFPSSSSSYYHYNILTAVFLLTFFSLPHSLQPEDREKLKSAANKVTRYATFGSLIGLGLGIALAIRLRQNRLAYFNAFKAMERPESVVFAGGRTGVYLPLPNPTITLPQALRKNNPY